MMIKPQPEPHLDADQLNAFVEGVLSAPERALCLQHLAECVHCREIAFLAGAYMPSEEPAPIPVRKFSHSRWSVWWPGLSLGAAALAAVLIAVLFLRHTHQNARPAAVQVATELPAVPPPPRTTAGPMNRATPEEPRTQSILKPSPARRAAPKTEPVIVDTPQLNNTSTSDSAALSLQAGAGAAVPQQLKATGRAAQSAPAAPAPLAQPSQSQAGSVAKTAPASTLRAYDNLALRTRDGSGQITGTITDSNGAAVAHARVTLDPSSGTAHRETFTDAAGQFTISSLPPGKYRVEISSPGFTAQVREVELGTSQLARVDSQLAVSAATESVTVQAAAAMLNTQSASVQSILPDKEPLRTSVTSGTRTLALDSSGKLFLSKKAGKHWKTVHGPWKKSAVTELSLTPDQDFKVTTAQNSWLSADGEHWHPAD